MRGGRGAASRAAGQCHHGRGCRETHTYQLRALFLERALVAACGCTALPPRTRSSPCHTCRTQLPVAACAPPSLPPSRLASPLPVPTHLTPPTRPPVTSDGTFSRGEDGLWDTPEAARWILTSLRDAHAEQLPALKTPAGQPLDALVEEGLAAGAAPSLPPPVQPPGEQLPCCCPAADACPPPVPCVLSDAAPRPCSS